MANVLVLGGIPSSGKTYAGLTYVKPDGTPPKRIKFLDCDSNRFEEAAKLLAANPKAFGGIVKSPLDYAKLEDLMNGKNPGWQNLPRLFDWLDGADYLFIDNLAKFFQATNFGLTFQRSELDKIKSIMPMFGAEADVLYGANPSAHAIRRKLATRILSHLRGFGIDLVLSCHLKKNYVNFAKFQWQGMTIDLPPLSGDEVFDTVLILHRKFQKGGFVTPSQETQQNTGWRDLPDGSGVSTQAPEYTTDPARPKTYFGQEQNPKDALPFKSWTYFWQNVRAVGWRQEITIPEVSYDAEVATQQALGAMYKSVSNKGFQGFEFLTPQEKTESGFINLFTEVVQENNLYIGENDTLAQWIVGVRAALVGGQQDE